VKTGTGIQDDGQKTIGLRARRHEVSKKNIPPLKAKTTERVSGLPTQEGPLVYREQVGTTRTDSGTEGRRKKERWRESERAGPKNLYGGKERFSSETEVGLLAKFVLI